MRIAVIGLGTIGKTILKSLLGKGHTIIGEDKIENLIEKHGVPDFVAGFTSQGSRSAPR